MNDVLQQMLVTTANGEQVLFLDLRNKAKLDGRREEYEAARLDNLMRLGVTIREEGPLHAVDVSITGPD